MPYDDWLYVIKARAAVNEPGMQHYINITWSPGMRADFRDIRVSDSLGSKLNYYLEYIKEFESCKLWVKINKSVDINIHFGNGAVESESDGNNTFEIFEDFENGVSEWTEEVEGSITIENDNVYGGTASAEYTQPSNGHKGVYRYIQPTDSLIIEHWWYTFSGSEFYVCDAFDGPPSAQNGTSVYMSPINNITYYDTAMHQLQPMAPNTWHSVKLVVKSVTKYDIYLDNAIVHKDATIRKSVSEFDRIGIHAYLGGRHGCVDNIIVRKYSEVEPVAKIISIAPANEPYIILTSESLYKLFQSNNNILTSNKYTNINDITINKIFESASNIILSSGFNQISDIQISKGHISISTILNSLVQKGFINSNYIFIDKNNESDNDIRLSKSYLSSNDLLIILNKIFNNVNDVQIVDNFESNNDINASNNTESQNSIYYSKIFISDNDIIELSITHGPDVAYPTSLNVTLRSAKAKITARVNTVRRGITR